MHVLLEDDLGRLTLGRLRPWHRLLARFLAARLDRQLADGALPEAAPTLSARALQLTSMEFRRDLAGSLRRLLAAGPGVRPPQVPACWERIRRSAPELAELARRLAEPGPVPAQGVAMVSQLLADGGGPLYRVGCRDDLTALIARAGHALTP